MRRYGASLMDEDSRVVVIVSAATGVIEQMVTGGSPTAAVAAGVSPMVVEACRRAWSALRGRQAERVGELIAAAEVLDPGLGILDERRPDYDARLELLNRVLEAAARSTLKEKIPALARVLVDGLRAEGDVGEALILAAALDLLEEPHVVLLDHLGLHSKPPAEVVEVMIYAHLYGWQVDHVERALPRFARIADGLIAVLAGQGLLRDAGHINFPGSVGPAAWAITPLGRQCLFLLGRGDGDGDAGAGPEGSAGAATEPEAPDC